MAGAFGFSVGDIIKGIALAKDVIRALSDSRGSCKDYVETTSQLHTLEVALRQIEGQSADLENNIHCTALLGSLTACQAVIDEFLQGIEKYDASLRRKGPKAVWRDALRKIQWQLCIPEEVAAFRGKISFYVYSIGLLLHVLQYTTLMSNRVLQRHENITHSNLLHDVQLSVQGVDLRLGSIEQSQVRSLSMQDQLLQALEGTKTTLIQQYQLLAQNYTAIPAQIIFSAAVTLRDAHNRRAPFNLQFIDCWESLLSVLQNLFRDCGAEKVKRREFLLKHNKTGRPIQFESSWSAAFHPGDFVDMDMLIRSRKPADKIIGPGCMVCEKRDFGIERECENCGSSFQRITDVTHEPTTSNAEIGPSRAVGTATMARTLKRKRAGGAADELELTDSESDEQADRYKRVQVHCLPPIGFGSTHSGGTDDQGYNAGPSPTQGLATGLVPMDSNGGMSAMLKHEPQHATTGRRSKVRICPYCPDHQHWYPREDNLRRHIRVHHPDQHNDYLQYHSSPAHQSNSAVIQRYTTLAIDTDDTSCVPLHPNGSPRLLPHREEATASIEVTTPEPDIVQNEQTSYREGTNVYDEVSVSDARLIPPSPTLQPARPTYVPELTPPAFVSGSEDCSSPEVVIPRYPSFCMANRPLHGDGGCTHGTLHACAKTTSGQAKWATPDEVSLMLEETLMSYRLLFGQSKASRRLSRTLAPFENVPKDGHDGLLDELCVFQKGLTGKARGITGLHRVKRF